jgi:hypothetical protein
MNNKLNTIAENIRQKSDIPSEEKFGSVIAILMIISIVLTLVRVLQECNKTKLPSSTTQSDKYALYGEEMKSYSIRKGWFTKLRIKKIIRKQMSKDQYAKYSVALLNAILDKGENLKEDEVITLVEASNV